MANDRGMADPAQFRRMAEQTLEYAIVFMDPEGIITWWSPGARQVFGYAPGEAVGRPGSMLFLPEDVANGIAAHELEVARTEGSAEDDRWQLRKDGVRIWVTGQLQALRDEGGGCAGFCKLMRDRSDLMEQLETLRNAARELESSGQRKDVFLSTLSHELRNPLAPIGNAVRIIRMAVPAMTGELEYAVKVIERQMGLLQHLVDDLLDLTRVGAGKIELERSTLVVQDLLRQAVESAAPQAQRRRHELQLVVPTGPILVEGDGARLHQVVVNLVNNAIKYTPEGGRIAVKATTEGPDAVIRVEDSGVGIPPEMLPRIFDLFTQVEGARAYSEGGLGIGLSLVKNLVTLHGGSVQVKSDGVGKGSEFTVRLPLEAPGRRGPA